MASGWTVLRFAWEHVVFDQDWVADVLTSTAALLATSAHGRSGVQESP
ncbi:hypothetical protein [Quadrisphaera sp. KR29]